ncbi:ABC transporter permease [Ekhidna sp.]|uniref:ABC transporter permease n=1 Tax=Ekhidna sp. TaxID=2608089 RepID=UPI003BA9F039
MKKHSPPKWALSFLQFFYKERYREQIEGDLYELFDRDGATRKARLKFGWNAIRFFRLRYLKGLDDFEQLTTLAMIKNYFKVAIRTLLRQKSYSSINILGLAIGLASCLLITIYVNHERSYDKFFPEADQMYRVLNGTRGAWTPPLLAETMMIEVSEIEAATRIQGLWESLFQIGDRSFIQDGSAYGDPQFFKVFETEFLKGNPETALSEPNSVVLTESIAKKCFPSESAYGKTFMLDEISHKVTAVVADPPKNTHFPYKYIISDLEPGHKNWTGNSVWTYAKIQPNSDVKVIEEKLHELYKKYAGPESLSWSGLESFEQLMEKYPDRHFGYTLYPIADIHLQGARYSMGKGGDYKNVIIFSLVAIFILLIACVNYINMSTARSSLRSKEVGIRKALGSHRRHIISQFLVESILITTISVLLALAIASISIDYFNQLTGRQFVIEDLYTPENLLFVGGLIIVAGLLAGLYPAYIMSSFSPLKALRGQKQQGGKRGLRNGLVAFQFAISVFLIAATIVIFKQLNHMRSHELGLNIDQTLVINGGRVLEDKYGVFKTQLEQLPGVEIVGKSSNVPFHGYGDWAYNLLDGSERTIAPYNAFTSHEFLDVMDIELVKGRFFSRELVTDTASVVINEALAEELGWDDPIGKKVSRQNKLDFTIIGVMKDFNFTSLKREISPMIFRYGDHATMEIGNHHQAYVVAKVSSQDLLRTINEIEEVWEGHVRNYPLDAFFLDDSFNRHYEAETKFGGVFTTFTLLAIIIAFLGLFALTTFVLQKRFKEIAVRKVLGASVSSLLRMMIKDFTRLVVIGGIIGISLASYWLNTWLDGYSYRIDLSWYLLILPILAILAITWIVVSLKSYRAAVANPANALKDE